MKVEGPWGAAVGGLVAIAGVVAVAVALRWRTAVDSAASGRGSSSAGPASGHAAPTNRLGTSPLATSPTTMSLPATSSLGPGLARQDGSPSAPSRAALSTRTTCPAAMAFVPDPGVCIHRYEVELVRPDGKTHDPYAVPPHPRELAGYTVRARAGVIPQGHLGREQAELVCANTIDEGFPLRLCTTREWEAACRGPRDEFPRWRDQLRAVCNTGKFPETEHLVYRFYPEPRWTYSELNDRRINQEPGGLARTGAYARCTNDFGVFDMVGNLQEWTLDLEPRKGQVYGTIKGDHYMGQGKNLEGCAATNRAHFYVPPDAPDYRLTKDWKDYSTGTRCCTDPR